jgi:hypothetical protein
MLRGTVSGCVTITFTQRQPGTSFFKNNDQDYHFSDTANGRHRYHYSLIHTFSPVIFLFAHSGIPSTTLERTMTF